ncbi:molecular chaperone [Acinetobacter sp. 'aerobic (ED)']|uniref:fimbrial biogenesis chaperone n=1 Tax=Acinetobacter sp. 'aerobic (ED)' TaxID=174230 RepID=UPI00192C81A3|nr:fimbria/pilus periplasmic chaperone [Acinetobacter sp. 'aerobic (ED)']
MTKYFQVCKLATVLMCCLASSSFAGVTITGTRIIFPASQQTATVQLTNSSAKPAMVQAWLDNGDSKTIPEAGEVPFILTPPLTCIEAKKGQMIRLIQKGTSALPQDRESVYWFNILDIPATVQQQENQATNKLMVSIRTRIKLFYRPEKLGMSQQKAFSSLHFQYDAANKAISIHNPSPYYINFEHVDFKNAKQQFAYSEPLMVAPYATETIKPELKFHPTQASYLLINDYGGSVAHTAELGAASSESLVIPTQEN